MLVYDDLDRFTVEWNGSATFNVFCWGQAWDCFTVYGVETEEEATTVAEEWLWSKANQID